MTGGSGKTTGSTWSRADRLGRFIDLLRWFFIPYLKNKVKKKEDFHETCIDERL